MNIDEKLEMQRKKYGSFDDVSAVTDGLLMVAEGNSGIRTRWRDLDPAERVSVRRMLQKLGCILSPDTAINMGENYEAIAGYAMLASNAVKATSDPTAQASMDDIMQRRYAAVAETTKVDPAERTGW